MDPLSIVGTISILALGYYASRFASSDSRGLKTYYDGGTKCDIVFVHGTNDTSWLPQPTCIRGQWLKDLLRKDYPDARILTYGYQLDKRRINYLSQMLKIESNRLLSQLRDLRSDLTEKRPLIFLTYGLGGLIVKTALSDAAEAIDLDEPILKTIQLCTAGVVFFEPPFEDETQKTFSSSLKSTASTELDLTPKQESSIDTEIQVLSMLVGRFKSIEKRLEQYFFERDEDPPSPAKKQKPTMYDTGYGLSRRATYPVNFNGRSDKRYRHLVDCIDDSLKKWTKSQSVGGRPGSQAGTLHPNIDSSAAATNISDMGLRKTNLMVKRSMSKGQKSDFGIRIRKAVECSKDGTFKKAESDFFKLLEEIETMPVQSNETTDLTIEVLGELAHHFMRKGDYEKAELLFKRACTTLLEGVQPRYEQAAEQLEHAAKASQSLGRLAEAEKSLERALYLYSHYTKKTPADTELRLASLYDERGDFESAQKRYQSAYDQALRDSDGIESEECLKILQSQAQSCIAHGQNARAEEILERAKETWEKRLGALESTKPGKPSAVNSTGFKGKAGEVTSFLVDIGCQLETVYHELGKTKEANRERGQIFAYSKEFSSV